MTAIETIRTIMETNSISLSELAEYADMGTKSNICQLLSRNDLKVGTFVRLLETMGFQLVVQSTENSQEFVLDYEEV